MPTNEQKRIWQEEKEQMLRDKQRQGREVRQRKIDLKFGGKKRPAAGSAGGGRPDSPPDDVLRKRLGI